MEASLKSLSVNSLKQYLKENKVRKCSNLKMSELVNHVRDEAERRNL